MGEGWREKEKSCRLPDSLQSVEPDAGLNLTTLVSCPQPKSRLEAQPTEPLRFP